MTRDKYKTQVLLLHSEQSTLDSLTSGFNGRYTVHCATSGSEALNTLVDTPINVIVSAHNLPGMSGLDALREAKKRSPETIGILLAEDADDGLEALVGDEEVFQVVRDTITGESILELVENATQKMRLMTLAESANDNAADIDDPDAEHIVMETSENGATIISDGTGRLPTLDPGKARAAASIGSRSVDLLVLTKDQEFLSTIKDSSRGTHSVHYANTLAQADETIRKHKVGVAIVDAAMIGEKIEQLTQYLRKGSPRLVTIVAGRRGDGEMLMDLINRGKLYRFLLKPVSPGRARLAVEASVKHHLEAPDAAFKIKDGTTATLAAPNAAPQAKTKPEPKIQSGHKPRPATGPEIPQPNMPQSTTVAEPTDEPPGDDSLASAFGDEDSNFSETVTGLISSVGKKFSRDEGAGKPKQEVGSSDSESSPAAAGSGGSILQNKPMLGIAAAAIVVLAVVLFWFMSKPDATVTNEESIASTTASDDKVVEDDVADEAQASNADTFGADVVVNGDAGADSDVVVDSDAVVDAAADVETSLAAAETALLESRLEDADAALQLASSLDPDNERLPFLTAQLSQLQLSAQLTDARAAIREKRFEDASSTLEAARSLSIADSTEIDAVAGELNTARSEQRALDVLAMANARLEDGDLLSPPNDNARYYYELALSNDAENTAARQGLNVVASKLALQARSEIDNGNLDAAEDLLGEANIVDSSNSDVAAAVAALSNRRDEIAAERQRAEAQRRAEAEQRAADARAEAERQAEEEREAEQRAQAVADQPAETAAERPAEQVQAATDTDAAADDTQGIVENTEQAEVAADDAGTAAVAVGSAGDNKPVTDEVQAEKQQAPEASNKRPAAAPAAVSSLKRTKYVAPKYPRAAQRRNVSGWVDIVFTVTTEGTVKDLEIRNSEPGETFVKAATKAVEKWEFEPALENGRRVERFVGVRMMFALE